METHQWIKRAALTTAHMALSMSALASVGGNYYRQGQNTYRSAPGSAAVLDTRRLATDTEVSGEYPSLSTESKPSPKDIQITQGQTVRELILVDSAVQDKHLFFKQAQPDVAVVEIPDSGEGLDALTAILEDYANLQAVHLVSHAEVGALHLGGQRIDQKYLEKQVSAFAALNGAIRPGGDLLLYGCQLAQGDTGEDFLELVQNHTHADLAASDDPTGNAGHGGDWDLEIRKGLIETRPLPGSIALRDFTGVLAFTGTIDFSQIKYQGDYYGDATSDAEVWTSSGQEYALVIDGRDEPTDIYDGTDSLGYAAYTTVNELEVTLHFLNSESFSPESLRVHNINSNPHTLTISSDQGDSMDVAFPGVSDPNSAKTLDLSSFSRGISSITISSSTKVYVNIDDFEVSDVGASNFPPDDISLSSTTANHSDGTDALVGEFSTSDPDSGDTHSYALVAGDGDDDNGSFAIDGANLTANDAASMAPGNYSVRIETDDGNGGTHQKSFTLSVVDDLAPSFNNGTPSTSDTQMNSTTLTVNLSETGAAYYVVLADGEPAPNATQLKAGEDSNGDPAPFSGDLTIDTADSDFTEEITGLDSDTAYDIHVLSEDDNGNASSIQQLDIATLGADSDGSLTSAGGVNEPVGLSSLINSAGAAVDLFDFTLSDGGGGDGLPLEVNEVTLNVAGNSTDTERDQIVWRLDGPDAPDVEGTYDPGSGTITFSGLNISVADGANETYTVNAYFDNNTSLTDGHSIELSIDGDDDLSLGTGTKMSGTNDPVDNGSGSLIEVVASQLAFTSQPAGSVSGEAMTTQPVVAAQDDAGNIDRDFSETITLTEASAGSLSNNTQSASNGVATFSDLTYTATADQESFTLTANDEDGVGSDLPTVDANAVTSDVVATQLVFDTQPAPTEVTSDEPTAFTTVPVVSAVDGDGIVDTDYGTDITLSVTDPNDGTVDGTVNSLTATGDTDGDGTTVSVTPASGEATFTALELHYSAASLSDNLALSAGSGGLSTAESTALTAVQLPSVTDANISISGASGDGGAYKIGDTVTASWDNTAGGDDNSDLTGVTIDFSEFGGGAAVAPNDSSGVWTATYTIASGDTDTTDANVSVTASNANGDTTTADTTDATLDNEAPDVTDAGISLSGASGNDGTFIADDTLTVTWDTSVGGNENADIDGVTVDFSEFGGGAAVNATRSGDQWSAEFNIDPGSLEADNLNASITVTDDAGNVSTAADTSNASLDNQAPSVDSSAPAGGTEATDSPVVFELAFSETVEGLAASDFALTTTGSASGTVDSLSATSGSNVKVTVTGVSGEGTLRLDYTGTTATDAAGNTLGSFTGGTEHTVDTEAPDAPGVAFDQDPVLETDADNISLTLAGAETGTSADYTITSDGGGTAVTGSTAITSADQTLSGIDVSGLGDGTLTAELTLTDDAGNVSDAGTATAAKDAEAPMINSVEATDGDYAEGDTLVIVVEMNEDVTVSGSNATLDIDIGSNTRTADFASNVDGVLQFNYTIQADDNTDGNGVTVLADSITLNGDTITDGAGNDAELSFASHSNPDAQVDTVEPDAPTVSAPSEAVSVNEAEYTIAGGHTEDGIVINLYADADEDGVADDNTVLESATVEDGNWSVDYPLNQNADNALVAVAEDGAGNAADPVRVPVITHDDIAPTAPKDLALATDSDSGADDSDRLTNVTEPELNGTAEADATLTLSSDRDGEIGTATVDGNGDWSLTTDELSEGEHELTATATDAAGNTGGDSEALTLTIDSTAPTLDDIGDQSAPAGQSTGALSLVLDDDVTAPADLKLEASSSDTTVVPEANIELTETEGERTVEVTPAQPGSATVTLEAEDEAGNQASVSFEVHTNAPPTIDGTPPTSAQEGQTYEFVPSASDADGDDLVFSISGQPSWLSFDADTGTLSGIPTQGDIGQHENIQISVTDGTASASLTPFSIEVSAGVDSDGDGVSDHQEELDGTDPNDPDDYLDEEPPELTAPADQVLDAEALYTRVTLGQLLGLDAEAGNEAINLALAELASDDFDGEGCCNPTVANMENNRLLLPPGEHRVVWQAEDRKGNRSEAVQTVRLRPLVSLSKDQTAVEGNEVTFSVILNGESPHTPLTVPYAIDEDASSATAEDHDLSDGAVTFEEGETRVEVSVTIADDGAEEGEETLVVRLDDRTEDDEDLADGYDPDDPNTHDINSGAKAEHRIVIAEGNVAPRIALTLEQNGERRLLVARDGGPVTATAEVIDPNAGDSHELDWSRSDNVLVDTDGDNTDETFVFDPVDLNPGRYTLALQATDSAGETGFRRRHFVVVPAPPVLSEDEDSNNNGLSDAEEGAGDRNDNGIPDYRDNAPSDNVLPEEANGTPAYMMECDPGVHCGLGLFSLVGDTGGSRLTEEDIEELPDLTPDESHQPVGGIFDFEVNELPEPGQSVRVVAPQRAPIPADAVYRKYRDGEWHTFVEDELNRLHSAQGDPGYCPPPGDEVWNEGLTEGHYCVQLTIEDGGPNDADGEANGAVADPGAVSQAVEDDDPDQGTDPDTDDPDPEPPQEEPGYDDEVTSRSSGGSGHPGALVGLVLLGLVLARWSARRGRRGGGILPLACLLALPLMLPGQARADEGPQPIKQARFELGLYRASSSVSEADFSGRMAYYQAPVTLRRYDTDRRAYSLGVVLPVSTHVSFTAGYLDLGEVKAGFRARGGSARSVSSALNRSYPHSAQGWTIGSRWQLPLHERVQPFVDVGLFAWRSRTSAPGSDLTLENDQGTAPYWGAGLTLPVNDRISAGIKWQRLFFDNQQVNIAGATLSWSF